MALHYGGLTIGLHPDVYEPAEDSYLLAEALNAHSGEDVLDVGTGTGILALVAAKTASRVVGVDVNHLAVSLARENARHNGATNVEFRESDLFTAVSEAFDFIIFNPPYLPVSEDGLLERSWSGGANGMEVVERFLDGVQIHLKPQGRILLLASSLNGLSRVQEAFERRGFSCAVAATKKIPFETLYVIAAAR